MNFDENSLYNIKSSVEEKRYSLFELATWKNGLAFKKINFSETGVPVIKIAELNNGIGGTTAYTQQTFSEDVHLCKGDLLFSWSGNPQTSIDIFRFNLDEGWLNQHIFKVTPDEKTIDKDYFYFLMKNLKPYFTQIATNKQTTGLGHVTIADIKRMSVVVPSLDVQREIVSYIKPIDDKVELNTAINNNLEQQAQAIFDRFYDSISGKICALSEVIDIRDGTHDSPKTTDDGYPLVTSKHLLPFGVDISSANIISKTDYDKINERSKVNTGDILISMIGTVGLISYVIDSPVEFAIKNVGLFKTSQSPSLDLYILYYLKNNSTKHHIEKCLAGSTQKYISLGELRKLPIVIPPQKELGTYNSVIRPIVSKIALLVQENKRLANIRDTLLSKLMSGELDVSSIGL